MTFIQFSDWSQDLAVSPNVELPHAQKYNLHAVVASLLVLLPHIVTISPLKEYSEKVSTFPTKNNFSKINLKHNNLQIWYLQFY